MLIRIFLLLFGGGFLVAGISDLHLRLTEPRITGTSIGNLHAIRNLRRVRITGGILDAYDATGNYLLGGRFLDTIYIPYVPIGRTDRDPVAVLLVTRAPDIKDAFQKFISSGDFNRDPRKTLDAYSDFERLASTRRSIQGLVIGDHDLKNLRHDVSKTVPNLSDDVIIIEEGKDVSLAGGIGYLACAGFTVVVGWIIRPWKTR